MAQYHYFYELYKQKLHYHSAMRVGGSLKRKRSREKQFVMLSSPGPRSPESTID